MSMAKKGANATIDSRPADECDAMESQQAPTSTTRSCLLSGDEPSLHTRNGTCPHQQKHELHSQAPSFTLAGMMNQLTARNRIMVQSGLESFSTEELDIVSEFLRASFLPKRQQFGWRSGTYHLFSVLLRILLGLLPLVCSLTSAILQQYWDFAVSEGEVISHSKAANMADMQRTSRDLCLFLAIIGFIGASAILLQAITRPSEKSENLSDAMMDLEFAWNEFVRGATEDGLSAAPAVGNGFNIWLDQEQGKRRNPSQAFSQFAYVCNGAR